MDTLVSTFPELLSLCELARHQEARELAAHLPDGPERKMIEGAVAALTEPEAAKDLLSQAASELSGDLRDKANIWLACCYEACGENAEAKAVLDTVEPLSDGVAFIHAFTWAQLHINAPAKALHRLDSVAHLLNVIENPIWKGKYFTNRGVVLRKLNDIDGAIIAYTGAGYWYEQGGATKFQAVARNNLARALSDVGRFLEAHCEIDFAISEFERLDEPIYLSQAHDQKAKIYRAEGKFTEAERKARQAAQLLESRPQKELLAQSLITEALAASERGDFSRSLARLERAEQIGIYLSNQVLLFDVWRAQRAVAEKIKDRSRRALIEAAMLEGSARAAARKLGINHHAVNKAIKKFGIKRTPKPPKKRILNARKK